MRIVTIYDHLTHYVFSLVRRLLDDLQSEVESLRRKQEHILSLAVADPTEKVRGG